MKILILGATGRTGQLLVKQSLEQKYDVIAIARDPDRLKISNEQITVLKGNALDKDILMSGLERSEAVLCALGMGKSLRSNDLLATVANILIPAMNAAAVKRLIFLSAFGVGETFSQAGLIQKIIFKTFLRNIYADKSKADDQIRNSELDWTLVYPVVLTDAPGTGKYKAGEKFKMSGMPKIPRADVAEFMVKQLTDTSSIKRTIILTT